MPGYLERLLAAGRIAELPALFRLAPAADPARLSRADVEGLLRLDDSATVRFLYRQPGLAEKLAGCERQAYRTAVEHRDLEAARAVSERTGPGVEPALAGRLLDAALLEGDVEWLQLARWAGAPLPESPELVQVCRQLLQAGDRLDDQVAAREVMDWLGGEPDAGVGRFALALRDGRFTEALAAERADGPCWRQLLWVEPLCRALEAAEETRRRKRGA